MSHAAVPDGVDPQSAALLRRAYDLADSADGQQLYEEWAATYDTTMLDGLRYASPRLLVAAMVRHLASLDAPILDLGCGTGLVGAELAAHGATAIDGLDLSASMMEVAARRGIYRRLIAADLTRVLPIESATYGAAVCAGTFTSGHVDASCLDEVVRVLVPGGLLACTVHHSVWEPLGFRAGFERLTASGRLREAERREIGFYDNTEHDGLLLVFAAGPG
jgi:predicted TPR repeat methyltransferase